MKIYIDGNYYDRQEARISVFDHGLLYGDGVFEGIRIYGGKIFKLIEHLDRLYRSATALSLNIPLARQEMAKVVQDTVTMNGKEEGYIRLIVTRGAGSMGLDPSHCPKPTVIVIVDDLRLYPRQYYEEGMAIVTASTRRIRPDGLDPRIKSLNYLNNVLAKIEAANASCFEAVMLNAEGYVAECTADNIFIVQDGRLSTPSPAYGALDGITMRTVMDIADSLKIGCTQKALTRYDLYTCDECFMTGTGAEVIPVVKIDGRTIGEGKPGRITAQVIKAFAKLTQEG